MLVRDRQCDGARADTDVEHARRGLVGEQLEAALDHHFGLGPWDQHPRVDLKHEPPEPPLAQHVGERLAGRTARD